MPRLRVRLWEDGQVRRLPRPLPVSRAPQPVPTIPWKPAVISALGATLIPIAIALLGMLVTFGTGEGWGKLLVGAIRAWLVAVGGTLRVDGLTLTMLPIGATLVVALVAALLARRSVPASLQDLGAFAAMAGGLAGTIAAIASAATNQGADGTSVIRSTFGAFLVVGLGAAWGAASRFENLRVFPEESAHLAGVVRSAASAILCVLGAAVVVLLALLITHLDRAGDLWTSLNPGFGGGLVLGALCVLALPNLVLWVVAVMAGPGFALGVDSQVTLGGVDLSLVPGFPVFAALPSPGESPWLAYSIAAIPAIAGAVAGWRFVDLDPIEEPTIGRHLVFGTASGALAGLLLGLGVMGSQGSIGPGLLQTAGPQNWWIVALLTGVVGVGGACGSAVAHYRVHRASRDD